MTTTSITEQVAALAGWQRARIDWIRVEWGPVARPLHPRPEWAVIIEWQGMVELAAPSSGGAEVPPGVVGHMAWVKPSPVIFSRPDGSAIEPELTDLVTSGIIGDAVCDRIEQPGQERPRWRVQAWLGCTDRVGVLDGRSSGQEVLAAHADLCLAEYRLRQAKVAMTGAVHAALGDQVRAEALAGALGVTRARVYQLRDGRR